MYPCNAKEIREHFGSQVPEDILEKRMEKYPLFFVNQKTWPYKCYVCGEQAGELYGDNVMGAARHLHRPVHESCLLKHPDALFGVIPSWGNDAMKARLKEWNDEEK